MPTVQGDSSLRVLIVPEAVDSQSDVRQSDQRKSFDVLITEVTSDGNVKPIVGVSAK